MWLFCMSIHDSQLFNSAGITLASNNLKGVSEFLKLVLYSKYYIMILCVYIYVTIVTTEDK